MCSRNMKLKPLSELELEAMIVIWQSKICTIREVLEKLNKPLAYTTISTIIQRLYDKGLLTRNDKDFVVHYSPKISKEEYGKSVTQSFFAKFFHSFGDTAIASFAESIEELPKEKKDYFLKLLEKHNENP